MIIIVITVTGTHNNDIEFYIELKWKQSLTRFDLITLLCNKIETFPLHTISAKSYKLAVPDYRFWQLNILFSYHIDFIRFSKETPRHSDIKCDIWDLQLVRQT